MPTRRTGVDPVSDLQRALAALALTGDAHALDLVGLDRRKIDVKKGVRRPAVGDQPGQKVGAVTLRGLPLDIVAVAEGLAETDRRDAQQRCFHGARDGARIGHVLGRVEPPVHA